MRCETHGLATGPDGRCVLCRETERPGAPSAGMGGVKVAAALLFVAAAGLAVFAAVRVEPKVTAEPNVGLADDGRVLREVNAGAVARSVPERQSLPVGNERAAPVPAFAQQTEPQPTAAPPSGAVSSNAVGSAASGALPAPSGPAGPDQATIQAAFRATPIVMFATPWCPACKRARAFLDANGLRREEKNVERDERANAELKRLTGESSVPAFVIDGQVVGPGFSESSIMRAIAASVERRLDMKGLGVRSVPVR